jgi:hypothetical protein
MARPLRINSFVIAQCINIKSSSNRVAMSPADVEEREGTDAGKCFGKCAERGRGSGGHEWKRVRPVLRFVLLLVAPFTSELLFWMATMLAIGGGLCLELSLGQITPNPNI